MSRIGGRYFPKSFQTLRLPQGQDIFPAHHTLNFRKWKFKFAPASECKDPFDRGTEPIVINIPSQEKLAKLPVFKCLPQVIALLRRRPIVAVHAPTGSGKTLLLPKALIDAGFKRVLCMEPTQVSTISAAETVSGIWDTKLGEQVGYCHGSSKAVKKSSSIIYATNGFQLAYDLAYNFPYRKGDVLVFDEAHKVSVSMEFQLALLQHLRERARKDPSIIIPKILIMSATMNLHKFELLFRKKIPVIAIKPTSNSYPITHFERNTSVVETALSCLKKRDGSVLVFVPGSREVQSVINEVKKRLGSQADDIQFFPLHSRLSEAEQMQAVTCTGLKLVVATDIAQESLTIRGIKYAIKTGLVRRIEIIGGVSTLTTVPYSRFDSKQQSGRVGRESPGVSISLSQTPENLLNKEPDHAIHTSEFASEIIKILASPGGWDLEAIRRLKTLNKIPKDRWESEVQRLKDLKLISAQNHLTKKGRRAVALPLPVSYACMIVTAEDLAIANQNIDILRRVIDVVCVMQVQGILLHKSRSLWSKFYPGDPRSEAITEATLLNYAHYIPEDQLKDHGISRAQFHKAKKLQLDLYARLGINTPAGHPIALSELRPSINSGKSDDRCVLESIWSGLSNSVYRLIRCRNNDSPVYHAITNQQDKQHRTDFFHAKDSAPILVVGLPFNFINSFAKPKPEYVQSLSMTTEIDIDWLLREIADKHGSAASKLKELKKRVKKNEPDYGSFEDDTPSPSKIYRAKKRAHKFREKGKTRKFQRGRNREY